MNNQDLLNQAAPSSYTIEELEIINKKALEGKQNVPMSQTPPTEQNQEAAAGDSSLADSSLESPIEIKPVELTAEDVAKEEESVVALVNEQISQYGLIAETANIFGSAIKIRKRKTDNSGEAVTSVGGVMLDLADAIEYAVTDPFTSISLKDRDINDILKDVNAQVKELADTNYLKNISGQIAEQYDEYADAITPNNISQEELQEYAVNSRNAEMEALQKKAAKDFKDFQVTIDSDLSTLQDLPGFVNIFESEKQKEDYIKWYNNDVNFSKESLAEYDQRRKTDYAADQSAKFLNNLEDWEREAFTAVKSNELNYAQELRVEANSDIEKYKANVADFENQLAILKNLENPTEREVALLQLQHIELSSLADSINEKQNALKRYSENDLDVALWAIGDASLEYNRINQLGSFFKGVVAPQAIYLYGQINGIMADLDAAYGPTSALLYKQAELGAKDLAVELQKTQQEEAASFQRFIEFENIDDFDAASLWVEGAVTNLIPSLSMAMTGPAALPLFFISGAGGTGIDIEIERRDANEKLIQYGEDFSLQYDDNANIVSGNENWNNLDAFEKSKIVKEIQEYKKALNITKGEQLLAQALNGTAEVIFERIGTISLLKKFRAISKTLPAAKWYKGAALASSQFIKAIGQEGGSEYATMIVQNTVDIHFRGKDKNYFEGGLETFAQGGLMGAGLSGAPKTILQSLTSEIASRRQEKKLKEITTQLSDIFNAKLKSPDIGALSVENLDESTKELVRDLVLEADNIQNEILESFVKGELSAEELKAVGEQNRIMRKITTEMSVLTQNPSISKKELAQIVKSKEIAYKKAQEKRYEILEQSDSLKGKFNKLEWESTKGYQKYNFRMLGIRSMLDQYLNEYDNLSKQEKEKLNLDAKISLENEGQKDLTTEQITNRAKENFKSDRIRGDIQAGKRNAIAYATDKDSGLDIEFVEAETDAEIQQKVDELYEQGRISDADYNNIKKAIADKTFEAVNIADSKNSNKDIVFVSMESAISGGSIGIYAHEVLHSEFRKLLRSKEGKVDEVVDDFLKYLESEHPTLHAAIMERMKAYTDKEGNFEAEEVMTAFSDILARGAKFEVSALEKARLMLNRIFGSKTFKSPRDTFNFIKDFNKAAHFGGKATYRKSVIQGAAQPEPDEETNMFSRKELFDVIREAQPKNVKTKAEFQADPAFMNLYELTMPGGAIYQYVVSKFPGQDEKVRLTVESIQDRLINFDPAAIRKGTNQAVGSEAFVEFVMSISGIGGAVLDANKKLAQEAAREKETSSIDSEGAQQVAEVTPQVAETVNNRPEYKDLIRRRVVEESVINSIQQKLTRIVSLLKTKIDAKISKNVTVTPIIREIKKETGKQADIDFKQAMGGKKDGELRKFLLRNKAAILENMPTTWLSTAMPFAIQKKVDGNWTSDWKGKKVDREAMSTDLAGRTSGADLVRRLPKAVSKISDADFLSAIVDSKGAPLRGKKESLAKALAEEISFDLIKRSFDDNGELAQALIENQKRNGVENAENMGPEFKRQAERGNAKFNLKIATNVVQAGLDHDRISQSNVLGRMNNTKNWLNNFLEDNGIAKMYDFSTANGPNGYNQYIKDVSEIIIPLMPYDFWFRQNPKTGKLEKYTPLLPSKTLPGGSKISRKEFENIRTKLFEATRDNPKQKYGDIVSGISKDDYRFKGTKVYDKLMPNAEQAKNNKKQIREFNKKQSKIHRAMWVRMSEIISKDKNNARVVAAFMSLSTNDVKHPQRTGALITGWSRFLGQVPIRREHSFPNLSVMLGLLEASVNNNAEFSTYYDYISSNYRLVLIPVSEDKKVNKAGLSKKMTAGFDIIYGNWWDRYFNLIVSQIDGGLNSNDIILLSGDTLFEKTGVESNGNINTEFFNDLLKAKAQHYVSIGKSQNIDDAFLQVIEDANNAVNGRTGIQNALAKFFEADNMLIEHALKLESTAMMSKKSKFGDINSYFNEMIERRDNISAHTEFSKIRGQLAGKGKGRFKFFIAPGADDFRGLVHYAFAGKGKQGDKDMQFFEEMLMEPYFKGISVIDSLRQQIKREFKIVTKEYKDEYKMLKQNIPGTPFTYDQALRVYMWTVGDINIPGISEADTVTMLEAIVAEPKLIEFAEALLITGRNESWPKPSEYWEGESVLSDLNSMTEKVGRKDILAEFIENADILFSETNLNKIEAAKGRKHREAIEDALYAMKNGSNRPSGANRQLNKWLNWINGSTGAIMFFNRRSALLQMLSFANFINWSDNNPLKAAAAFANQKQYWKDFAMIFNSDKLKERRGGLRQDVNDSELAQVASGSKNSPQAILAYLLKIGFKPTQIADSFAIATGGASFYRNRVNTYLKKGMSQKAAEEQAFLDFSMQSDVAQQSSDPALVSQEQRSVLGRLVLAFANTPMQYTRLMKKAGLDLINGRGDWKANVSKIAYYGFVQNFIFSALQGALFALAFDDDDDDNLDEKAAEKKARDEERKIARTINSMIDTVLRGSGIYGAIVSTIKNTIQQYYAQENKGFMADHTYTVLSAISISPPIGSKLRKLYGAIQTRKFEKDNIAARGWALTANGKLNIGPNWAITGQIVSGAFNIPLDRVVDELKSVSEALDARNKAWQRIALALGWKTWDVGAVNEEADLIQAEAKIRRKKEGIKKAKETRRKKKKQNTGTGQTGYTDEEINNM